MKTKNLTIVYTSHDNENDRNNFINTNSEVVYDEKIFKSNGYDSRGRYFSEKNRIKNKML